MTIAEMVEMRRNGATYREIGAASGMTGQNAYNIINRRAKKDISGIRGRAFNIEKIKYKGIYEHFKNDEYECISSFAGKVFNRVDARYYGKTRNLITGEQDVRLSIHTIMKICEVVGKPFEEVFEVRK